MIVYKKSTGEIIANLPNDQDYKRFFCHCSKEFIDILDVLDVNININTNLDEYKVVENQVVKRDKIELNELRKYGKTLTEEERQLEKLKPTQEEVRKAEQTIEILTLIQEVI